MNIEDVLLRRYQNDESNSTSKNERNEEKVRHVFTQRFGDRCRGDLRNGRNISTINKDCICFECSIKETQSERYEEGQQQSAVKSAVETGTMMGLALKRKSREPKSESKRWE